MLAGPEQWRRLARHVRYGRIGPFDRLLRSFGPQGAAMAMRNELEAVLAEAFEVDPGPPVFECYFSIVTTPPEELTPIQRLPHVDAVEQAGSQSSFICRAQRWAVPLSIASARPGSRRWTRNANALFDAALRAGIAEHGLPLPAYVSGDTLLLEKITS